MRQRVGDRGPFTEDVGVLLDSGGELGECKPDDGSIALRIEQASGWSTARATLEPEAARILDLYVPLCVGANASSLVVGHLAQSLDGRVATNSGISQFISGEADLVHTHRLRALFDAVIVGAGTAELDDPQLTTRRVEGSNPTRVVLDGRGRLRPDRRVFNDGNAPTLLVRGRGAPPFAAGPLTEVVEVDVDDGWMALPAVIAALAERGLRRLFIEGGGVTVSRFIRAKAMDRLHITVAPVLFGSGRPAIVLPEIESLQDAIQLKCRHIPMGPDMLFDCPLSR
ncbi:MAG: RibD family protein [Nannocystaceae bacterium]|nr:RibD family protein [Nannocystaceae bacterium]